MSIIKSSALILIAVAHLLSDVYSQIDQRIIAGVTANRNQYPFFAKLTIIEWMSLSSSRHECGGALITENAVVTAAHCLAFGKQLMIRLRMGFFDAKDNHGQQSFVSRRYIKHEQYNADTLENDIGLVLLPTSVKLTDSVQPIQINCAYTPPDQVIKVIGAGMTGGAGRHLPDRLYTANLKTISNDLCEDFYDDIYDTVLCSGSLNGGATCHGDSGGPAVIEAANTPMKLIGVISFGSVGKCDGDGPNGFTRIASYVDWIAKNVHRSIGC